MIYFAIAFVVFIIAILVGLKTGAKKENRF
jgi:hypothetical protein